MTYRDGCDDWLARRAGLETSAAEASDLDQRELLLEDLRAHDRARRDVARRHLPVISAARRASTCLVPFEAMRGSGARRVCTSCEREVIDVARLTLDEAAVLRGDLRVRSDGTLSHGDCPIAVKARRTHAAVGAFVLSIALGLVIVCRLTPAPTRVPSRPHVSLAPPGNPYAVHYVHHDRWEPSTEMVAFEYFQQGAPAGVPTYRPGSQPRIIDSSSNLPSR